MSAERRCDVCGSDAHSHLFDVNGFPVVRCRVCGLVFVGRTIGLDELIALYDESYYEDAVKPGYAGYGDAEQRKRHHDRTLLDQLESYRGPGDLLEIGCAYGYFLDEARQRGWRVRGIEPSAHAARHARERLGLEVSERQFPDVPAEPASQDAIALWDVVEHLPNPRATLEHALVWLRPGGILALSTGNVASLTARIQGADWSLMTPPWHQFYFSRSTMGRLLADIGFQVIRWGGDGTVLVDPSAARPRIRGPLGALATQPAVTRVARRLGAGAVMFVFAQKL